MVETHGLNLKSIYYLSEILEFYLSINLMKTTKKNVNLIYDVWLHKGEDTLYYLQKWFDVIAFEADPELVQFNREKYAHYISKWSLTIVEWAIVPGKNTQTQVSFYKNKDKSVWWTVANERASRNQNLWTHSELITVQTINFVEQIEKYWVPYYIKIDIEWMDTVCLNAFLSFEHKPDYISIESEKVYFDKLLQEFELFEQLWYTWYKTINQLDVINQIEPTNWEWNKVWEKFIHWSSWLFGKDLPWARKTKQDALSRYRTIFRYYERFGDSSFLKNNYPWRLIRKILRKFFHIPWWYDTHAKHKSS